MPKNLKQDLNDILERTDIAIEPETDKSSKRRKVDEAKLSSPKEYDPLNPQEHMSSEELIIRRDEWRKIGINNRLKSKLADNIPTNCIKQASWMNKLIGSIPRGIEP